MGRERERGRKKKCMRGFRVAPVRLVRSDFRPTRGWGRWVCRPSIQRDCWEVVPGGREAWRQTRVCAAGARRIPRALSPSTLSPMASRLLDRASTLMRRPTGSSRGHKPVTPMAAPRVARASERSFFVFVKERANQPPRPPSSFFSYRIYSQTHAHTPRPAPETSFPAPQGIQGAVPGRQAGGVKSKKKKEDTHTHRVLSPSSPTTTPPSLSPIRFLSLSLSHPRPVCTRHARPARPPTL